MKKIFSKIAEDARVDLLQVLQRIIDEQAMDEESSYEPNSQIIKNPTKLIVQSFEALTSYYWSTITDVSAALHEELKRVNAVREKPENIWNIVTVLVPAGKRRWLESKDFFPVAEMTPFIDPYEDSEDSVIIPPLARPMFLNVDYKDFSRYLEYDYEGSYRRQPFMYHLSSWDGFCDMESDLAIFARLYGIGKPPIFSPWARRAVRLKLEDPELLEKLTLEDLRLQENGLAEVLLADHILMWNVKKLDSARQDCSSFLPDSEHMRITYKNCPFSCFIKPLQINDNALADEQINIERDGDSIIMTAPQDMDLGAECSALKIYPVKVEDLSGLDVSLPVFVNTCEDRDELERRPRVRTRGEINRVLHALSANNFQLELADEGSTPFTPYKRSLGHQTRDYRLSDEIAMSPVAKLYFKCSVRDGKGAAYEKYRGDYAAYTSRYLEKLYPEYKWIGVEG